MHFFRQGCEKFSPVISDCPPGTWGEHCARKCACTHCDPITGYCTCPPGTTGADCRQSMDVKVLPTPEHVKTRSFRCCPRVVRFSKKTARFLVFFVGPQIFIILLELRCDLFSKFSSQRSCKNKLLAR